MRFILSRNIVCGNALSLKAVDENGNDTTEPIIFSEWSFVGTYLLQRLDFRFDKKLSGDYEAKNKEEKKKKKLEPRQMNLLEEESSEDNDEPIARYVCDYRRVQNYGN